MLNISHKEVKGMKIELLNGMLLNINRDIIGIYIYIYIYMYKGNVGKPNAIKTHNTFVVISGLVYYWV